MCLCVHLSSGIRLTGGIGSKWQGIYCLDVVPGSPASEEGSVQPSDKILYICGRCTLGMTLEDAVKACEIAPRKVKLKIIRYFPRLFERIKRYVLLVSLNFSITLLMFFFFFSFDTEKTSQLILRLSGTVSFECFNCLTNQCTISFFIFMHWWTAWRLNMSVRIWTATIRVQSLPESLRILGSKNTLVFSDLSVHVVAEK